MDGAGGNPPSSLSADLFGKHRSLLSLKVAGEITEGRTLMSVDLAQTARLLVSDFLTTVRAPVLSRRFQQAVATASGPVWVNVGAGTVVLPGWINTDVL